MSSIVEHAPKFTEPDAVRIAKDLFALDADAKPMAKGVGPR